MTSRDIIRSADTWRTNAELMATAAELGYLPAPVLDLTYGRGLWWTRLPDLEVVDAAADFTALPHDDNAYPAVTYDPPYIAMGGRKSSGLPDFQDRYGLAEAPRSPGELQTKLINPGLAEAARVANRFVLVKSQNYISSGKLWMGTFHTRVAAAELGLTEVDHFVMVRAPGPQPGGRRQVHARQNYSTLIVFRP